METRDKSPKEYSGKLLPIIVIHLSLVSYFEKSILQIYFRDYSLYSDFVFCRFEK